MARKHDSSAIFWALLVVLGSPVPIRTADPEERVNEDERRGYSTETGNATTVIPTPLNDELFAPEVRNDSRPAYRDEFRSELWWQSYGYQPKDVITAPEEDQWRVSAQASRIYRSPETAFATSSGSRGGNHSDNSSRPDPSSPIDLWLLGLFPFEGSWPGGLGQLPAVEMGIEDVNKHPDFLPGYRLHMTVNDTAVSEHARSVGLDKHATNIVYG